MTEGNEEAKAFAQDWMRTSLILKDKARRFHEGPEIRMMLAQTHVMDEAMREFEGSYSRERAAALKTFQFVPAALVQSGYPHERLDQMTVELLLGAR